MYSNNNSSFQKFSQNFCIWLSQSCHNPNNFFEMSFLIWKSNNKKKNRKKWLEERVKSYFWYPMHNSSQINISAICSTWNITQTCHHFHCIFFLWGDKCFTICTFLLLTEYSHWIRLFQQKRAPSICVENDSFNFLYRKWYPQT